MCISFTCKDVSAPLTCLVLVEARKRHWIFWTLSYMVVSHHDGADNQTQVSSQCLSPWSHPSNPMCHILMHPLSHELTTLLLLQEVSVL